MKISVIHDYPDVFRETRAYQKLKGHDVAIHTDAYTDPARVVEQVKGCDALVLTQQRVPITREVIEQLPDLKMISQTGGNVYHLDIAACTEHGIVVSAGGHGGGGTENPYSTTAELAWGLILASLRHIPFEVERMKQGHWQSTAGTRLYGRTLGVYAFGHIGAAVARVGKAFGMKVMCWGREGSTGRAKAEGFEVAASREAFFESADIVSLHLTGGKDTRGIVTAADLARMKPTALHRQHQPRADHRRGRAGGGAEKGAARLRGDRRLRERAGSRRHKSAAQDEERDLHAASRLLRATTQYEGIYGGAVNRLLAYAAGKPIDVVNPGAAGKR